MLPLEHKSLQQTIAVDWQRRRGELRNTFASLNDRSLLSARVLAWATAVDPTSRLGFGHQFAPQGVSVAVFGDRCRALLHSWPEHGIATFDVSAPGLIADVLVATAQQCLFPV